MDHRERNWLFVLIGVFLVFNIVTLSPADTLAKVAAVVQARARPDRPRRVRRL